MHRMVKAASWIMERDARLLLPPNVHHVEMLDFAPYTRAILRRSQRSSRGAPSHKDPSRMTKSRDRKRNYLVSSMTGLAKPVQSRKGRSLAMDVGEAWSQPGPNASTYNCPWL